VVLPESFDRRVVEENHDIVTLIPAPGIANISAIHEMIADEILTVKSGMLLQEALDQLGVPEQEINNRVKSTAPLITPRYEGPPTNGLPLEAPPYYGVPALFLLLAFLFAAQAGPGRDNRRIACTGENRMLRSYLSGCAAMILTWLAGVVLYVACMKMFYGVLVPLPAVAALTAEAWYASALGSLLAVTGRRNLAAYFFVPWLLVNMTMGGGLWHNWAWSPALAPVFPVSAVVNAAGGGWDKAIPLFVSFAAVVVIGAVYAKR
jgi:hypothetical protein